MIYVMYNLIHKLAIKCVLSTFLCFVKIIISYFYLSHLFIKETFVEHNLYIRHYSGSGDT